MTNEEIIEEIYHKAYDKGFIGSLRSEVEKLRMQNSTTPHIEIVEKAYHSCKKRLKE